MANFVPADGKSHCQFAGMLTSPYVNGAASESGAHSAWSDLNGPALLFTVLEAVLNLNVELLIAEQDISASKVTFYAAVEHDASVATLTRFFPFHLNSQLLAIRV